MITPSLSLQNNKSINDITGESSYKTSGLASEQVNNTNSSNSGYNFNNNILFRHSFAKKGRTLSVNLNTSLNNRNGDTYSRNDIRTYDSLGNHQDSLQQQFNDLITNGYQVGAYIAFTEPVGKKGQLQFNYSPSYSKSKSDQEVYQYDYVGAKYSLFDDSLSNKFDNIITKQSLGASYRVGDRDNMFSIGVNYQYTELNSDQTYPFPATVSKNFNNVLPILMWRKNINA
jgi:hypothetical protein